jgi:hypothetical protein
MHCVLWLSQLSSALCWRLLLWGFWSGASRVVFNSQDGQLWAGQRWSDMNNMYGWLAENTCRGAGRLHSMALCIFLSFTTAHSEGGAGNGYEGSGSMLLHVRAFWMGFPGWLWHCSYLNLSGPGFGGGLCECGPLAGNVCVIHTIPNSLPLLPDPGRHHNLSCIRSTMHAISHLL